MVPKRFGRQTYIDSPSQYIGIIREGLNVPL